MIQPQRLLDRTLSNLRLVWRNISHPASNGGRLAVRPDLPERDLEQLRAQIRLCLDGRGGVVSAKAHAARLGELYLDLDQTGKRRFLATLAEDFAVDREALAATIAEFRPDAGERDALAYQSRLRQQLTPPHLRLLTQFNALPQGVKFLVDLRHDLRELAGDNPQMRAMDEDLKELLTSWFDIGFLNLQRLTWQAPAALLEKLIQYEAVHEIQSWTDLKNRLDAADRRVYGYFHPRMPDEPLIFVQVALTRGIADNIQTLLNPQRDADDPAAADTAIFYSISNAQPGLQGVSLGNFLIKRVVDDLMRDLPRLKTFATLSPIPGFRAWLSRDPVTAAEGLLSDAERESLIQLAGKVDLESLLARTDWYQDEALTEVLQPMLMRLAAHYLARERKRGRAINPVANFHLSNGARIERLNWLADRSAKGLRESAGLMVNYLYNLGEIEHNHEAYREACEIATSGQIKALMKEGGG